MTPEPNVDVVGVGANSVDYVAIVPALAEMSAALSKLRIERHAIMCGGQTATTLAACSRFGLSSRYIGATGDDSNGRLVRDTLGRLAIDVSGLAVHDASNQFAIVLIDRRTGERVIFWSRDERLNLVESERRADALLSARLIHVDDTDEGAAIWAARFGRDHGIAVTSDIDRVTPSAFDLIDAVAVAIFAENVPIELTGGRADRAVPEEEVIAALRAMPRRSGQVLCATLGRRGAVALDDDGVHRHPGFEVAAVDTTGAGDVFRAGLIYARLQALSLDEQLRFANAAAAASCTKLGALGSVPSLGEVQAVLALR